jgi:uncharacterized repeat protein (TIGR03837 family)
MERYCPFFGPVDNPGMQANPTPTSPLSLLWDVFCQVIDNFGDIGVCWRLCADLASRGHSVRLWVDDPSALQWMAPGATDGAWPAIQVMPWPQSHDATVLSNLTPADVWVEGFGCEVAPELIAACTYSTGSRGQKDQNFPFWVNLEYLSAESYVERCHALPSPILHGPAQGLTKHFFYPGFTLRTGGLLREPDLLARQQALATQDARSRWLEQHGIRWMGERLVSLFCYEPVALPALLSQLDALPGPTQVLVTAGRATAAAQKAATPIGTLRQVGLTYLPALTQVEYDHLLWICDLNCVRGEDSLVRALWAGKPLLWQIYPQHDAAHIAKLDAFLDVLNASASLRAIHLAWNSTDDRQRAASIPVLDLQDWSKTVQTARQRLLQMDDLVTQLVDFVRKKR